MLNDCGLCINYRCIWLQMGPRIFKRGEHRLRCSGRLSVVHSSTNEVIGYTVKKKSEKHPLLLQFYYDFNLNFNVRHTEFDTLLKY